MQYFIAMVIHSEALTMLPSEKPQRGKLRTRELGPVSQGLGEVQGAEGNSKSLITPLGCRVSKQAAFNFILHQQAAVRLMEWQMQSF